jgi:hypothetical protein
MVAADHPGMRHLTRRLPGTGLAAIVLCVGITATAVAGNGYGGGSDDWGSGNRGHGTGNAPAETTPAGVTPSAAPTTPPGQAKQADPATTPPGQSANKPGATPATPATPAADGNPATPATPATPASEEAPTPVPPAAAPVIGESMGVKPVDGTVRVRLPNSTGYVSLAAAGSVPSGAVVDARQGAIVLRTAVANGRTQAATIRGAIFEVRQSATGKGMTDLILRQGPPASCSPTGSAAVARAAMAHGFATKKANSASGGLWAHDKHGRFRTRGRDSVATVRGTRWVTRETCAGTLTRVMEGAVDVFDLRKHRTVRVSAGHAYLARTSG